MQFRGMPSSQLLLRSNLRHRSRGLGDHLHQPPPFMTSVSDLYGIEALKKPHHLGPQRSSRERDLRASIASLLSHIVLCIIYMCQEGIQVREGVDRRIENLRSDASVQPCPVDHPVAFRKFK